MPKELFFKLARPLTTEERIELGLETDNSKTENIMTTEKHCRLFRNASTYAAGWIVRQPSLKEESITDWLLDYVHQHSTDIRYYLFDRIEEGASSGADWDWWFLLRNGCFKIRVQAKKIKKDKDHYKDLAHFNKKHFQIDLLLDSSARHNFYPIYGVYGLPEQVERCQRINDPNALFICSAQEIYDMLFQSGRRRILSSDILSLCIPMECLFCCPLSDEFHGHGPRHLFENYFRVPPRAPISADTSRDQEYKSKDNRGFEKETPHIIKQLFEMHERNTNTEGIIKEYQSMFSGSNGIIIIKHEGMA